MRIWGAFGIGQGSMTIDPDGEHSINTDIRWRMLSGGFNQMIQTQGPFVMSIFGDLSAAFDHSEKSGALAEANTQSYRIRLGLEEELQLPIGNGREFQLSAAIALRQEGGDTIKSSGVEFGSGITLSDQIGLEFETKVRMLIYNEERNRKERGISAALRYDPYPVT